MKPFYPSKICRYRLLTGLLAVLLILGAVLLPGTLENGLSKTEYKVCKDAGTEAPEGKETSHGCEKEYAEDCCDLYLTCTASTSIHGNQQSDLCREYAAFLICAESAGIHSPPPEPINF